MSDLKSPSSSSSSSPPQTPCLTVPYWTKPPFLVVPDAWDRDSKQLVPQRWRVPPGGHTLRHLEFEAFGLTAERVILAGRRFRKAQLEKCSTLHIIG